MTRNQPKNGKRGGVCNTIDETIALMGLKYAMLGLRKKRDHPRAFEKGPLRLSRPKADVLRWLRQSDRLD